MGMEKERMITTDLTKEEISNCHNKFKNFIGNINVLTEEQAGNMSCSCRVIELEGFEELLTPEAREVYNNKATSTVEVYNKKTYDTTNSKRFISEEATKSTSCQIFTKQFYLENDGVPFWAVRKVAATFNKLVKENMIDFKVLSTAMIMVAHDLIMPSKLAKNQSKEDKPRGLFLLYCYPSNELEEWASQPATLNSYGKLNNLNYEPICGSDIIREELNYSLGSECFVQEGEAGDFDWEPLPDLETGDNNEL